MSIFQTPYIKSIKENNDSLYVEIFSKSRKCGNIHISNTNLTYGISCGLKIAKGNIKIKNVNLRYEKEKLILTSLTHTGKKLLNVNCSKDIFESINSYISKKKLSFQEKKENKNFLFDEN